MTVSEGAKPAGELDERVKENIGHQSSPSSITIRDDAEKKRAERAHCQSEKECKRHRRNVGAKFFGDVLNNEYQDEEIESIQSPSKETRDNGATLLGCKTFELFKNIHRRSIDSHTGRVRLVKTYVSSILWGEYDSPMVSHSPTQAPLYQIKYR
jgi:hypothetical protein